MQLSALDLNLLAPGRDHSTKRLSGIRFELQPGSLVLLLGRTGSGKSSLLDCLAGLTPPSEGNIRVGERLLWNRGMRDRETADSLGIVFQRPEEQLFARTVREEFAYSLKPLRLAREEAAARITAALQAVGLSAEILQESPHFLSGGQKRRVALASAFACRPQWLLLDEPTAGLDGEATQTVADFLIQWKQRSGCGIVLATHDLDMFLPLADRVLLMEHGTIAADVSGAELLERPELLAACGLQPPGF
ncbi:energy-coupling factor ABC transporter ATP-binding protein, partial [Paenibacillus senegalensis]|uniref:energy-coupling factor ABC transporter ATP-binding protein n=1 Tax=Paenibacillus senegalensis TaxID=1465766 RepID=UPI0002886213